MRSNYGGFGAERQARIYTRRGRGEASVVPVSSETLEAEAARAMTPEALDYVSGGAGSGESVEENKQAFRRWRLAPRLLTDVSRRDTTVEFLGRTLPAPIALAPVSSLGIVHKDGDLAVARAAQDLGLPLIVSTVGSVPLEEVSRAAPDVLRCFQLYWGRDPDVNASLARRAEAAGYSAIVLTPDLKIVGWRERDLARGYLPFLAGAGIANFLSDPVFRTRLPRPPEEDPAGAARRAAESFVDPSFAWEDLRRLRAITRLPVLLKGVLRRDDVAPALEAGVAGLIVSNHGGRQVEGNLASVDALPGIVEEVAGRVPVLLDSGIRRGADVLVALALGASAVLVGRPYVYGLALAGQAGVTEVLENLLADFDVSMGVLGCASIREIDRSFVVERSSRSERN